MIHEDMTQSCVQGDFCRTRKILKLSINRQKIFIEFYELDIPLSSYDDFTAFPSLNDSQSCQELFMIFIINEKVGGYSISSAM